MAEFTEIWESWKRMCQYQRDLEKGSCVYSSCPLRELKCNSEYPKNQIHYDGKAIEEIIAKWAVDHPEPVYPTWEEWLITQGVIKENQNGGVGYPMPKLLEPVPAEIRVKLGLQPKER